MSIVKKNLLSIVNTWKSAYKNVDCFFEQQKIRPSMKGYDKLCRKISNVDCNFLLRKRLLEWKYLPIASTNKYQFDIKVEDIYGVVRVSSLMSTAILYIL